ncbi:lysozyme inhibitor LprI family protein [Dyella sp. BiH032]|uniref:lysozyme inhibitor LprI family protein n=1 Tax=Dyella sp. BiH032 TaxID=3075430 RepID=UPI002893598B|nr:lysozyme inhibitor LprI family protein [Dyella sp. BiH032]WNL47521.1 lysozyme inhibitor LprI family protein [Dyella sp. BiH032]
MKMFRTIALPLTLALLANGTVALAADSTSQVIKRDAPKGISAAFYACIDKAGSDTTASAACLMDEKQKQDARLNAAYKKLLAKLDSKAKDQLVAAERAWLDLQGKTGRLETSLYGDETISNLQLTQNEIFRLCERANELEKYLSLADDQ